MRPFPKYRSPKSSIRTLMCLLTLILAGCSTPKNVAVANRSQVAGSVYPVKLLWIGALYVDKYGSESLGTPAAAAGALAGNIVANGSRNQGGWADLAREGARAVANVFEGRSEGRNCQYLLETKDVQLLQSINPRYVVKDNSFDPDRLALEDEITFAKQNIGVLKDRLAILIQQVESNSENPEISEVTIGLEELLEQRTQMLELMEQRLAKPDKVEAESKVVTVFNPCRDFEKGDNLLVLDAGYGNIVLERNAIDLK